MHAVTYGVAWDQTVVHQKANRSGLPMQIPSKRPTSRSTLNLSSLPNLELKSSFAAPKPIVRLFGCLLQFWDSCARIYPRSHKRLLALVDRSVKQRRRTTAHDSISEKDSASNGLTRSGRGKSPCLPGWVHRCCERAPWRAMPRRRLDSSPQQRRQITRRLGMPARNKRVPR
jgi:hypothetical protein